ncbi:glycosyl transferase, partial [Methylobacterium sp. A54F]
WSGAVALPPEIDFLAAQGVAPALLVEAVRLAAASGTVAATALLGAGLLGEEAYYRALARALRTPFLDGAIPLGPTLRVPEDLVRGAAPLAPGAPATLVIAPLVIAPRGDAIVRLRSARRPPGPLPAL